MDKRLFDEMINKAARQKINEMDGKKEKRTTYEGRVLSSCVYIGPRDDLKKKEALWRREFGKFLVQFNDTSLPDNLGFGWHEFPELDFAVDVEVNWDA